MSAEIARVQDAKEPPNDTWPNEAMAGLPLRFQAATYYVYVDQGISLATMATKPPFDAVPLRTLEHWSATDHWAERRRQALEAIEARIKKAVGDRIVQKRIELLDRLEVIEDEILAECEAGRLKFRSLEGAISALVRLVKFTDDLRDKIMGSQPVMRLGTPEKALVATLTPEEARVAAKAILEARRARMRNDLGNQD